MKASARVEGPGVELTPFDRAGETYRRELRRARRILSAAVAGGLLAFASLFFALGRWSVVQTEAGDAATAQPLSATPETPSDPGALEGAIAELERENIALKLQIRSRVEANNDLYSQAAAWVQRRAQESEVAELPPPLRSALGLTDPATEPAQRIEPTTRR